MSTETNLSKDPPAQRPRPTPGGRSAADGVGAHRLLKPTTVKPGRGLPVLAGEISIVRLGARTRKATVFFTSSRIIVQVLQLATTVVLSRILAPHDYGLIAIISSFSGFVFLFTDLGVGQAIIQRKVLHAADLATAFYLNLVSGVTITILLSALAVPIAAFYSQSALVPLIIVSSLGFSLSLNVVHYSLLQRGLKFFAIGSIEIAAAVLSGIISIVLALSGVGAMSLVIGSITATVVKSVLSWVVVRWLPTTRPNRAALKELWGYSKHVFGFNTIIYWSRNADDLILGRTTSLANLAQYARAYNLMLLPIYQVTQVITRVLFPALAGLQNDLQRLRRGYLRAVTTLMTVGAPATFGLAAVSPAFIATVYGSRWAGAAPLLTFLSASGPAQMIGGTFGSLYQATGRVRAQFRRGMINVGLSLVAIGIGAFWGPTGVAIGLLVKSYVSMPIASRGCLPLLSLTLWDVVRGLRGILLACAAMVAAILSTRWATPDLAVQLEFVLQLAVGVVVYAMVLRVVDPTAFRSFVKVIRRERRK